MADRIYTHWLVTIGRSPSSVQHPDRFVPVVVMSRSEGSLKELRHRVQHEVRHRTMIFCSDSATNIEKIKAISGVYATRILEDLWVSEIRLSSACTDVEESEEAIFWILALNSHRLHLPNWQGPADGTIPASTPVTIRMQGTEARFLINLHM